MPEQSTTDHREQITTLARTDGALSACPTGPDSSTGSVGRNRHIVPLITVAGLLLATWLAFSPILGNDFIDYFDDGPYVTDNPMVQQGLTWQSIRWAFTESHAGFWLPLVWLSHMVDCELYGLEAWGHHLSSLLFHAANVLLVLWLLYRMSGQWWLAAITALIFAVHPLRVESVAWVAERKDVLSTFLWLLCVGSYLGYITRPSVWRYGLVMGWLVMGLMAKPMLVTLPFSLWLLDAWPLRRLSPDSPWHHHATLKRVVLEKLPLLAIVTVFSGLTVWTQSQVGAMLERDGLGLGIRVQNAVVSYVAYLGDVLWPSGLAIFYHYPQVIPAWKVAAAAGVLITVTLAGILLYRQARWLLIGWLWFLGTLFPVIGIAQSGQQARADRFTYVPLLGICWIIAAASVALSRRLKTPPAISTVGWVVLAAAMILASRAQTRYWQNSVVAFQRAIAVAEDNYFACYMLGNIAQQHGHLKAADRYYQQATELRSDFSRAYYKWATALNRLGRHEQAIATYQQLIDLDGPDAAIFSLMGDIAAQQQQWSRAIESFKKALALTPEDAYLHYVIGDLYRQAGQPEPASQWLTEALALDPSLQAARRALHALDSPNTTKTPPSSPPEVGDD